MLWAPSPSSKCTRHCNWQNLANMPPSTPLVPVLNELGITTDNILRMWHCTAPSVVQEMASTSTEAPAAYSVSCSKRLAYLFGWDRVSWFFLAIHSTPFRLSLGWEKWKLRLQTATFTSCGAKLKQPANVHRPAPPHPFKRSASLVSLGPQPSRKAQKKPQLSYCRINHWGLLHSGDTAASPLLPP